MPSKPMQSKSSRLLFLAAAAVSCLGAVCVAQNSSAEKPVLAKKPATASKSLTKDVILPVIVRDRRGAPVTNLTASNFTLTDNGHPQVIKSLTLAGNMPVQIGLLVDTSGGMARAMDAERAAAEKFVDLMLPADPASATSGNQMFLIHFDSEVELLQGFTGSRNKLQSNLQEMGPTSAAANVEGPETNDGDNGIGGPSRMRKSSPRLYDAIYLASDDMMKSKHGRKVLVIFSNGLDNGSKETFNEAVDAAERTHTVVYTIYFRGDERFSRRNILGNRGQGPVMGGPFPGGGYPGGGYPGRYPGGGYPGGGNGPRGRMPAAPIDGRRNLGQIATRTGGLAFAAGRDTELAKIYSQIASDLQDQYLLTYAPDQLKDDGIFHTIDLKVDKKGLTVNTPEGYFAPGSGAK